MNKIFKLEYIILTIILVLGFLVRLYKIGNPIADWHSWRQADTASVSKVFLERGINFLYPRYHDISSIQTGIFNPEGYRMVEVPIYNAIHAFLAKNISSISFEVLGRLISVVSAISSALVLFLIGNRIIGKWGGIWTAFFYLFIPYNIYFTRVILPEPFAVALGLFSIYLFILFVERQKNIFLYSSGIFLAIAMLIKPFFGFYLVPLAYLAIRKFKPTAKNIIKGLIFADIVLVPFFLWRAWVSNFPAGIPFFEWAFNGDRIRFHPAFWRWIFGERLGILILGGWGLIPFIAGFLKKNVNKFILYFLLGMFFYVSVVATANVRHDYYQILTIPAISLALAEGSLWLWKRSKLILLASLLIMLLVSWDRVKPFYQVNHYEIVEAGKEVDFLTPKDALVVAPYNGDTAFLYQTNRWGWPAIDDSIENIIKKGADYYVSVDLGSTDTKNFEKMFKTVEKTDKYIILDLHSVINHKKV